MACQDAGGQSRLAFPLLGTRKRRRERSAQIREEVTTYFEALERQERQDRIYGAFGFGGQLEPVEIPDPPEVLLWLDKVEIWGFPNPGTWLDQPKEWLTDIEQARLARKVYLAQPVAEDVAKNIDNVFKDKPVTGEL